MAQAEEEPQAADLMVDSWWLMAPQPTSVLIRVAPLPDTVPQAAICPQDAGTIPALAGNHD